MNEARDVLTVEESAVEEGRDHHSGSGITIHVVTTPAEFDELRSEYDELLDHSEVRIFQTFEWQRTWWNHFGEGNPRLRLHIVLVRRGSTLLGVAPLFLERVVVFGVLGYRRLSFIGRGPSDYLDIIARHGNEEVVAEEVARYIAAHRSTFDLVQLEDVPDASRTALRVYEALRSHGMVGERFLSDHCPRMQLGVSWEETVKSFPSSHRNRLTRNITRVLEGFNAEYERIRDPGRVQAAMDDFIRIHQKRWNDIGHRGVFDEERVDRFHRAVAPLLMERGRLLMAFLRVGGERLVGDYGLLYRGVFSTYLGGAIGESEFLRNSPGLVVRMCIMKECIADGVRVFDFMRGTERYKYGFGAVNCPNWTITMFTKPGGKAPLLHRMALIREAIGRRAAHEMMHLKFHARKHGVPSMKLARYMIDRVGLIVTDGWHKLRAPEKSVAISKEQE